MFHVLGSEVERNLTPFPEEGTPMFLVDTMGFETINNETSYCLPWQ